MRSAGRFSRAPSWVSTEEDSALRGGELGVDEVGDAEEVGDELGPRALVELGGRAGLLDPARVHHGDGVGHGHGLLLVVRDVHERDADVLLDALELDLELLAQPQVERAERLVEQQRPRAVDERAGERDALLLAAGELSRLALAEAAELDELERLADALGDLGLGDLLALEPEGDVALDAQVREERVRLEDRVDVALVGRLLGHLVAAEVHAPLRRVLEAADHPQRRRLAAARRAEHRVERAALDRERELVDRGHLAEALGDLLEVDVRLGAAERREGVVLGRRGGRRGGLAHAETVPAPRSRAGRRSPKTAQVRAGATSS